jgi:hypothetical protein
VIRPCRPFLPRIHATAFAGGGAPEVGGVEHEL